MKTVSLFALFIIFAFCQFGAYEGGKHHALRFIGDRHGNNTVPPMKHAPGCTDFYLSKWKPKVTLLDCTKSDCHDGYVWLIDFEEPHQ